MVERRLAKAEVAGSSPVSRSIKINTWYLHKVPMYDKITAFDSFVPP